MYRLVPLLLLAGGIVLAIRQVWVLAAVLIVMAVFGVWLMSAPALLSAPATAYLGRGVLWYALGRVLDDPGG
jgi:hypothetical protein